MDGACSSETFLSACKPAQQTLSLCYRQCCGVYVAVLKQLPTESMWSLYLEMLLELNQDRTDLRKFKKNLLRDAFKGAHNAGCMQEKYYLLWVSVCYFHGLSNT